MHLPFSVSHFSRICGLPRWWWWWTGHIPSHITLCKAIWVFPTLSSAFCRILGQWLHYSPSCQRNSQGGSSRYQKPRNSLISWSRFTLSPSCNPQTPFIIKAGASDIGSARELVLMENPVHAIQTTSHLLRGTNSQPLKMGSASLVTGFKTRLSTVFHTTAVWTPTILYLSLFIN